MNMKDAQILPTFHQTANTGETAVTVAKNTMRW